MSLLARKIDKGKWLQTDILNHNDVSADAVTLDLRTKDNKLSVWEIDSNANIQQAALALAAGQQHLETFDVVLLDPQRIREGAVDIETPSPDQSTPVADLRHTHRNLYDLSYIKLGTIAALIIENIRQGRIERYTKGSLKQILNDAIDSGRLQPDRIHENLRRKLNR